MTDRVGQQLGNYRLLSLLGQGGFAEVYLGEHIFLRTHAAIKVLRATLASSEMQQFLHEAQTLVLLRHPHIVKVLEFGVENGTPFLVMDYAPHGTLRQRHAKGVPLPLNTIMPYLKEVASALFYAHEQRVIHCDVKPENMLLGHRNEVLLSDFGLAVITQSSYYQTQEIMGTIYYTAPEQIQGKPCPASDQYALGIVVYEWLSGTVPFSGSFIEVANQHILAPPPPLRQKMPTLPPEVEQVVMIALNKNPQQRFRSVQAFANALGQASRLYQPSPVPPSPINGQMPGGVPLSPSHPQPPTAPVPPSQPAFSGIRTLPEAPSAPLMPPPTPWDAINRVPTSAPLDIRSLPPPQPTYPTVTIPPTSQPRRRPLAFAALLSAVVLLILAGGGLSYYFAFFQPGQLHAQATATAQAQLQRTAQANATSTASVHATATAHIAATATATNLTPEELYATVTSGTPVFEDPLNSPNDTNWNTYTTRDRSGCGFAGGALHVTALSSGDLSPCFVRNSNYSDFAFQVQITILKGDQNNFAGFLFRSDGSGNKAYYFAVSPAGVALLATSTGKRLGGGISSTGLNQPNVFTIIARGNSIYLYANGQYLTRAEDNSYHTGAIGLVAFAFTTAHLPTDAAFQNAKLWIL